ncbi:transcriptional regulator [Staphylococcus cohnii]|nr:transcriptional regulator [Staphylococcus cohnii]
MSLTDSGIECIEQYMTYKQSIEKHIAKVIGTEQLQLFKTILHQDWQLEDLQ